MKPINLNNTVGEDGGSYTDITVGPHLCEIREVTDYPNNESLGIGVEVAEEGELNNYYTGKGWNCPKVFLSYADHDNFGTDKDTLMKRLAYAAEAITEQSAGIDAKAAIFAGKEQMLVGGKCYVVFRDEEYWSTKYDKWSSSPKPYKIIKAEDADRAVYVNPRAKKLNENKRRQALERAGFHGSSLELRLHDSEDTPAQGAQPTPEAAAADTTATADTDDIPF